MARIERAEELCDRLKQAIVDLVPAWTLAPVVAAVQALRGVSILVAATVVAEVGNFSRFDSPRQLMAYLGLNPSEHSSGATIKRGADHQDRQQSGAHLPGRGSLDLPASGTGDADHSRSIEGAAGADPCHCLEGAGATCPRVIAS